MSLREFAEDKTKYIAALLLAEAMAGGFLWVIGIKQVFILLLLIIWLSPFLCVFFMEYVQKKQYFTEVEEAFRGLDQKSLLSEIISEADFVEGKKLFSILKATDKYVSDMLQDDQRNAREYKEYVEMWIHEVKVPLTAARLLCAQNKKTAAGQSGEADQSRETDQGREVDQGREAGQSRAAGQSEEAGQSGEAGGQNAESWGRQVEAELDRVEAYTEQALYYARSTSLEKDFFVKRLSLAELVTDTLKASARELIRVKAAVELGRLDHEVYGDPKWLSFILRQILSNSVKYRGEEPLRLTFFSVGEKDRVSLKVEDNGIGIPDADLGRVFDKGFTGQNGRKTGKSTGIGLYLCKKLCAKMNLEIRAYSQGQSTCIEILFPVNSMIEDAVRPADFQRKGVI